MQVGPWWGAPITFVLDLFRSIPLLIQLVLVSAFLGMVLKLQISGFVVACGVLTFYTAAYCSEIVRGGIDAVPATTRRAARSLGLTWGQDMRYIVAPLATRVALPSWIGLALGVMKDSALVYVVGVTELSEINPDPDHPPAGTPVPLADVRAFLLPYQLPGRPFGRISGKTVVQ